MNFAIKRTFLWLLIGVSVVFGVVLCSSCTQAEQPAEPVQLSAPVNLMLDKKETLTWNKVENASSYLVTVNKDTYTTTQTSIDLFPILNMYGTHTISVTAVGDEALFLDSQPSEQLYYQLNTPQIRIAVEGNDERCWIAEVEDTFLSEKVILPGEINGYPLTAIADGAFENCTNLTSIIIPDSVTEIGERAFAGCTSLTHVWLPQELELLGKGAFLGCSALSDIRIPVVETLSGGCFSQTGLTHVVIPEGVIYERGAFNGCGELLSISYPASVILLNGPKFDPFKSERGESHLQEVVIHEDNIEYFVEGNCIIEKATDRLIFGCGSSVIPDRIEEIGFGAFCGASLHSGFALPKSLTTIDRYAFAKTDGWNRLILPDALEKLDSSAFFDSSVQELFIPAGLQKLPVANAFYGCGDLHTIAVAEQNPTYQAEGNCVIRKEDNVVVLGCSSSVIPAYATGIGANAFAGMQLREIEIPASVTYLDSGAFTQNFDLQQVTMHDGLQRIGEGAFSGCYRLKSVFLPATVTHIQSYAFDLIFGFSITIPASVTMVEADAFYHGAVYYDQTADVSNWKHNLISGEIFAKAGFALPCVFGYDNGAPYVEAIHTLYYSAYVPLRAGYLFGGWTTTKGSTQPDYKPYDRSISAEEAEEMLSWGSLYQEVEDYSFAAGTYTVWGTYEEISAFKESLTLEQLKEYQNGKMNFYAIWIPIDA